MKEGEEGGARAVEGGEERGASPTSSRLRQSFLWEWVLLKNRELVRDYSVIIYKLEYPYGHADKKAGEENMLQSWCGCGGGLQFCPIPYFFLDGT